MAAAAAAAHKEAAAVVEEAGGAATAARVAVGEARDAAAHRETHGGLTCFGLKILGRKGVAFLSRGKLLHAGYKRR